MLHMHGYQIWRVEWSTPKWYSGIVAVLKGKDYRCRTDNYVHINTKKEQLSWFKYKYTYIYIYMYVMFVYCNQHRLLFDSSSYIWTWYLEPKLNLCIFSGPYVHWCKYFFGNYVSFRFLASFATPLALFCLFTVSAIAIASPPPSSSPLPNDHCTTSPASNRVAICPHAHHLQTHT